jgi:hypothetical protein
MVSLLLGSAVVAMLAFMFVKVAIMLRRDRIRSERERTRGQHAFTPKHRARFLLKHAFQRQSDEATTQQLLAALSEIPATPEQKAGEG